MLTVLQHTTEPLQSKETNGTSSFDHAAAGATRERKPYDYGQSSVSQGPGSVLMMNAGGNPLAHWRTNEEHRLAAFGGEFQPGLYA
jgi:hypothetical protein